MRIAFCLILVSLSFLVSADEKIEDTVYYVLSANQVGSNLNPFRFALASRGYYFQQFNNDQHDGTVIRFLGQVDGDSQYSFRLITAKSLFTNEVSPILYARYDDPMLTGTIAEYINIDSFEHLIDYLDFTIRYINGDCATVMRIGQQLDISTLQPVSASFVNFAIGNCMLYTDDINSAVIFFTQAVSLLQDTEAERADQVLASYMNLVWTYVQLGDYESARELLNQVMERRADFPPNIQAKALETRAQLRALMFDYTSAISDMDLVIQLVESNRSLSRAYKQRGDIIMLIYEWDRALQDYNKAIELDAEYAEAYYRRGILYYTMVERENAIADFELYLDLAPDGQFFESAEGFIDDIQTELETLGG